MKLNVLRADPAGNITLFVLDPIENICKVSLRTRVSSSGTIQIVCGVRGRKCDASQKWLLLPIWGQ